VERYQEALSVLIAAVDAPVIHHPVLGPQWLKPALDIAREALADEGGE
jgi:hypothetical protein